MSLAAASQFAIITPARRLRAVLAAFALLAMTVGDSWSQAELPVAQQVPTVRDLGENGYKVTFTPTVAGLPVVNGQTTVRITRDGQIVGALAYAPVR